MICKKCGHKMNQILDNKDGVLIRIRYKCGNLDCRYVEKIERNNYKEVII